MALCAQPFGWLTLVEAIQKLLLLMAGVQRPKAIRHIEEIAERASRTGVQVAVQDYVAA